MKRIAVSVDVTAHHRGTYWAGMIEQMGTLVYAPDLESLREEVSQTVDFLMGCFDSQDEMVAYFNRRGILHTRWQLVDYQGIPDALLNTGLEQL